MTNFTCSNWCDPNDLVLNSMDDFPSEAVLQYAYSRYEKEPFEEIFVLVKNNKTGSQFSFRVLPKQHLSFDFFTTIEGSQKMDEEKKAFFEERFDGFLKKFFKKLYRKYFGKK